MKSFSTRKPSRTYWSRCLAVRVIAGEYQRSLASTKAIGGVVYKHLAPPEPGTSFETLMLEHDSEDRQTLPPFLLVHILFGRMRDLLEPAAGVEPATF